MLRIKEKERKSVNTIANTTLQIIKNRLDQSIFYLAKMMYSSDIYFNNCAKRCSVQLEAAGLSTKNPELTCAVCV